MSLQDDLQEKFVNKGLDFFKTGSVGYFDLAMRFGKCKTTIELLKKMQPSYCSVLIAYPDNNIKKTWMDEFIVWKYDNQDVTFVNFSSLKKYTKENFDFFIIDEFHSCSPQERDYCKEIINNCENTLCLSGTVSETTKFNWGITEIGRYTTEEGIDDGILANYTISVHLVKLDTIVKTPNSKGILKSEKQKYDAYSFVIEKLKQEGRGFMNLALARNRLSSSSVGKMNKLRSLLEEMADKRVIVFTGLSKVADEIGIPSYHSKSESSDSFEKFQTGECNKLALAAMGKVGVTYKRLDSVILLNFTYNAEESSQILNRAIKLDYRGKVADLHILCLNEEAELKKIRESLSMLDAQKIKYV